MSSMVSSESVHYVEKLLREHLLRGFCLLEKACPACTTPLVVSSPEKEESEDSWPIFGIAYCVNCDAHVVSRASEIEKLDQHHENRSKGSIFVAVSSSDNEKSATASATNSSSQVDFLTISTDNNSDLPQRKREDPPASDKEQLLHRIEEAPEVNHESKRLSPTVRKSNMFTQKFPHLHQRRKQGTVQQPNLWQRQQEQVERVVALYQRHFEDSSDTDAASQGLSLASNSILFREGDDEVSSETGHNSMRNGKRARSTPSANSGVPSSVSPEKEAHQAGFGIRDQGLGEGTVSIDDAYKTISLENMSHDAVLSNESGVNTPVNQEDIVERFVDHPIEDNIRSALSHESVVDLAIGRSESMPKRARGTLEDVPLPEYNIRREIAVEVLSSMLVEGYLMKEEQCENCSMPLIGKTESSIESCCVCEEIKKRHSSSVRMEAERLRLVELAKQAAMQQIEQQSVASGDERKEGTTEDVFVGVNEEFSCGSEVSTNHSVKSQMTNTNHSMRVTGRCITPVDNVSSVDTTPVVRGTDVISLTKSASHTAALDSGPIQADFVPQTNAAPTQPANEEFHQKKYLPPEEVNMKKTALREQISSILLNYSSSDSGILSLAKESPAKEREASEASERKDNDPRVHQPTAQRETMSILAKAEAIDEKPATQSGETMTEVGEERAEQPQRVPQHHLNAASFVAPKECSDQQQIGQDREVRSSMNGQGIIHGENVRKDTIDHSPIFQSRISNSKLPEETQDESLRVKQSRRDMHTEFEAKRTLVRKEITAKMRIGWMLLDMTCSKCVMPMMANPFKTTQLCVLCREESPYQQKAKGRSHRRSVSAPRRISSENEVESLTATNSPTLQFQSRPLDPSDAVYTKLGSEAGPKLPGPRALSAPRGRLVLSNSAGVDIDSSTEGDGEHPNVRDRTVATGTASKRQDERVNSNPSVMPKREAATRQRRSTATQFLPDEFSSSKASVEQTAHRRRPEPALNISLMTKKPHGTLLPKPTTVRSASAENTHLMAGSQNVVGDRSYSEHQQPPAILYQGTVDDQSRHHSSQAQTNEVQRMQNGKPVSQSKSKERKELMVWSQDRLEQSSSSEYQRTPTQIYQANNSHSLSDQFSRPARDTLQRAKPRPIRTLSTQRARDLASSWSEASLSWDYHHSPELSLTGNATAKKEQYHFLPDRTRRSIRKLEPDEARQPEPEYESQSHRSTFGKTDPKGERGPSDIIRLYDLKTPIRLWGSPRRQECNDPPESFNKLPDPPLSPGGRRSLSGLRVDGADAPEVIHVEEVESHSFETFERPSQLLTTTAESHSINTFQRPFSAIATQRSSSRADPYAAGDITLHNTTRAASPGLSIVSAPHMTYSTSSFAAVRSAARPQSSIGNFSQQRTRSRSNQRRRERAPSPGISLPLLPTAASSIYSPSQRRHDDGQYTPKISPEESTWGSNHSPRRLHRNQIHKKEFPRSSSFRPIATPRTSAGSVDNVIDVEPLRTWKVGNENVIVVDERLNPEVRQDGEDNLDALLTRIEKTKSQLEVSSLNSKGNDSNFRELVDNLARTAKQMREIELS